ncbi:MAG: C_GCAxxG_C_C family protein [Firmicutes bacterium]|jgi:C_GCAxxG_C_C family probable redox protein|nr:C_GCAxxG_C_C family protein [Bacillota bacterium]
MSERSDRAVELFRKGFACSQSVLAAYSDLFGLDEKTALRISDGFGGGIARRQDLCGAVSGAVMLLGLRYGRTRAEDTEAHERTFSYVNRLCDEFIRKYGSLNCGDILGCDWPTVRNRGLRDSVCTKCVRDASQIVERLLQADVAE